MSSRATLVVGLGNPGPEYEHTRHNAGFRVVEIIAEQLGSRLRAVKGVRALAAEARDGDVRVILAEPTTFMNLSGEAVGALCRYYKVELDDIVVVHDDLDLPLGAVRLKRGGGDGGHNGLKHITRALGSGNYARVRIGIGRPPGRQDTADYVLEPFAKRERDEAEIAIREAADAVLLVVREGVEAAQRHHHAPPERPKQRRAIRKQVDVAAPLSEVWEAWTTSEGAQTFFAPGARIELRRGGPYELFFDPGAPEGSRGSEGCAVISMEKERRLSFTWNAPPSLPSVRGHHTRVDVRFEEAEAATRVSLTHVGWKEGEGWDEYYEYFTRAWDVVLERLQRRFTTGPIDWRA